jgi:outer membrane biogenesis lipoprotein LolB
MSNFRFLVAVAAALLLAACASTPQSRIQKNRAAFDSYPPEAQAKIQKGEADIGFTPEMVEMALDKPDRKYQRKTAGGDVDVWSYTDSRTTTERQRIETHMRAPDVGGVWHSYSDWTWVDVPVRHEYDRTRVEFKDGKVSAVETRVR